MNTNANSTEATDTITHTEVAAATAKAAQAGIDAQTDANTFRPYDSQLGEQPSIAGYRNVKCLYKTNAKTGKVAADNSQIRIDDSITQEAVAAKLGELMPHLITYLQGEEDKIVKKLHLQGMTLLSPKQYGLDSVIAALEAAGTGHRLNKEQIEQWFDAEMLEPLMVAFADKMGVSEQPTEAEEKKLETVLQVYRSKFGSLASGKTHYREEEVDMLLKSMEVTGAESSLLGGKFVARLTGMKAKSDDNLLLAL